MDAFKIETDRLIITEFEESMAEIVHKNSLDDDIRRFVPDEVFETIEEAHDAIKFLMACYKGVEGPFVYPILLKTGENIGYVQAVPLKGEWEVGYHIASKYTGNGYATEALRAFLPQIMKRLNINQIWGISREDNKASCRVLERSSFILDRQIKATYQGEEHEVCRYVYK